METFLTFILSVIIIFYLFGLVGRWVLRYWISKKQREFSRQFGGEQNSGRGSRNKRKEGDVSVQQTIEPQKKVDRTVGEYVEFEEVEEEEEEELK